MTQKTTIKVGKNIIKDLSRLKIHPRQSNEEVILKLIEAYNEKKNL